MNLETVCKELNNWFETSILVGDFQIENGSINLEGHVQTGQKFRIVGSVFNDGVYTYPVEDLKDETFHGGIWPMAVPKEVEELVKDINDWQEKYADQINSPFTSESFAGYSYSKASGTAGSGAISWQAQFQKQLNQWRKTRP